MGINELMHLPLERILCKLNKHKKVGVFWDVDKGWRWECERCWDLGWSSDDIALYTDEVRDGITGMVI